MKTICTLLLCSILLASCKKDNKDCPITTATLTGTFKLTGLTYRASGSTTESNMMATLQPCQLDDLLVLASNGTYVYQDAGTSCDPAGSYTGTWSVNGNTITVDSGTGTITHFDCDKIIFYEESSGDRVTFTYQRQ